MSNMDIDDPVQRAGAVYFVEGRGTEGGSNPYRMTVAANEWGVVSSVIDNSGYSIGTFQLHPRPLFAAKAGALSLVAVAVNSQNERRHQDAVWRHLPVWSAAARANAEMVVPVRGADIGADLPQHLIGIVCVAVIGSRCTKGVAVDLHLLHFAPEPRNKAQKFLFSLAQKPSAVSHVPRSPCSWLRDSATSLEELRRRSECSYQPPY